MKKLVLMVVLALVGAGRVAAQPSASEACRARYQRFVEQNGYNGIGVMSVLEEWKKVAPEDQDLLIAEFNYHIADSQTSKVVKKSESQYLGMKPMLELKDSTGAKVYYYEEVFYDEEKFSQAIKAADRAIRMYPHELNFRFMKMNAYMAYEKGSPDMALADLLELAELNYRKGQGWVYLSDELPEDFFESAIQDYCYSFYTVGTPSSLVAFKRMSERMLEYLPGNPVYMDNLGVYELVAMKDPKKAEKIFKKVLKKYPDDNTAISNCLLIARRARNVKAEKKYLGMLIRHGTEEQQKTAKLRLQALDQMK